MGGELVDKPDHHDEIVAHITICTDLASSLCSFLAPESCAQLRRGRLRDTPRISGSARTLAKHPEQNHDECDARSGSSRTNCLI